MVLVLFVSNTTRLQIWKPRSPKDLLQLHTKLTHCMHCCYQTNCSTVPCLPTLQSPLKLALRNHTTTCTHVLGMY
jgi:hypothetical protein